MANVLSVRAKALSRKDYTLTFKSFLSIESLMSLCPHMARGF